MSRIPDQYQLGHSEVSNEALIELLFKRIGELENRILSLELRNKYPGTPVIFHIKEKVWPENLDLTPKPSWQDFLSKPYQGWPKTIEDFNESFGTKCK